MPFWKGGWGGAPLTFFPKELKGLGSLRQVESGRCSVCRKPLSVAGYGAKLTRLCLGCAVVWDSVAAGRSEAALLKEAER